MLGLDDRAVVYDMSCVLSKFKTVQITGAHTTLIRDCKYLNVCRMLIFKHDNI
jgi:hypothetical protein